jgi:hypothetical protein
MGANPRKVRRYRKEAGKSKIWALLLGVFPPLSYLYVGDTKLAMLCLVTGFYALAGFVVAPLHCYWKIRRSRKKLTGGR